MSRLTKLLTLVLLSLSTSVWSASGMVTIGSVPIEIPHPSGLQNADPDAPRLVKLAKSMMTGEARFLMTFVEPKAIVESNRVGKPFSLSRYALVGTERSNENNTARPDDFKKIQDDVISTSALGTPKTTILSRSANQITQGFYVPTGGSENHRLYVVSTLCLIKGKILMLNMYYNPISQQELREAGNSASRWVNVILAANT